MKEIPPRSLCVIYASLVFAVVSPARALSAVDDNDHRPAWSPDGAKIAYTSRHGSVDYDVFVVNVDGSEPRRLTFSDSYDGYPAWSPDGKRIAFISHRDGNAEVYVMNADGSDPQNLTRHPADEGEQPTWSPDGKSIAFQSRRSGDFDIFVMGADGSDPRNITQSPGSAELNPAWSPEGDRMAFTSNRDGNREIYTMPLDGLEGSQWRRVTNHLALDDEPTWSPDGRSLAFFSFRHEREIYTTDLKNGEVTRLTNTPQSDIDPAWSPNGEEIAFTSSRDGRRGVYVMSSNGSGARKVTNRHQSWFVDSVLAGGGLRARMHWQRDRESSEHEQVLFGEALALGWRALDREITTDSLRTADAIELMKLAIELEPENPDAYSGLAAALQASGSESPPGRYQFRKLILEGRIDAAVAAFEKTRERFPDWVLFSGGDLNSLGYALLGSGKLEDAVRLFEMVVEAYPESANAFHSLSEGLREVGREGEAREAGDRAAELTRAQAQDPTGMSSTTATGSIDFPALPPEKQFDFLLGDWDIFDGGKRVGRASFGRIIDGAVIEQDEFYYSNGTVSKALWSYAYREQNQWVQSWVDVWGYHVVSKGGHETDRMVLYMTTKYFEANVDSQVSARQIFSEVEADSFRYTWEISQDGGKTWKFNNGATYKRRKL